MSIRKIEDWSNIAGTCLQGYTSPITVETMTALLGEPELGGDKTFHNWDIDIDGTTVTIYDWKQKAQGEHRWNVGGHDSDACKALDNVLREAGIGSCG